MRVGRILSVGRGMLAVPVKEKRQMGDIRERAFVELASRKGLEADIP